MNLSSKIIASISLKLLILGQSLTYVPFSMADSDAGSEEIEILQQQANFDINDQLNAIASDLAELQMIDRVSNFNAANDVDKTYLDNNLSDIEDVVLASEAAEESIDAIIDDAELLSLEIDEAELIEIDDAVQDEFEASDLDVDQIMDEGFNDEAEDQLDEMMESIDESESIDEGEGSEAITR